MEGKMNARSVYDEALQMPLARDHFDVLVEGWAELVARGDFVGADAIAASAFDNWRRELRERPEWADRYRSEAL